MGGAHTAEAPTLHGAGKALALRVTGDVDILAGHEVRSSDGRTDFEQRVIGDAELGDFHLQLDFRLGEMLALRLGDVLLLGLARTQLNSDVTVALFGANRDHLAIFKCQNGNRHVPSVVLEHSGHPELFNDHAGAHDHTPYRGLVRTIPTRRVQPVCETRPVRAECPCANRSERGTLARQIAPEGRSRRYPIA